MKTENFILSSKVIKLINEKFDLQLRLHQKKTRVVKVASLDAPQTIIYHYVQYRYWNKKKDKLCYFTQKIPGVSGKRRQDDNTILKVVEPVLKNKMTIKDAFKQARELLQLAHRSLYSMELVTSSRC